LLLRRLKLFTAHQYSDYLYPRVGGADCGSASRIGTCPDSPSWGLLVSQVIFGIFWLNGIVGVGTVSVSRLSIQDQYKLLELLGAIALTCTWMKANSCILNSLRPRSLPITRRQNTSVPNSIGRRVFIQQKRWFSGINTLLLVACSFC